MKHKNKTKKIKVRKIKVRKIKAKKSKKGVKKSKKGVKKSKKDLELKMNICRSYVRKINLGNYETLDIFASFTEEVMAKDKNKVREVSMNLYNLAKTEVLKDVSDILDEKIRMVGDEVPFTGGIPNDVRELADKLAENARHGVPSVITDYQKIEPYLELRVMINNAKKAFNRESRRNLKGRGEKLSKVEELKKQIAK